MENYQTWRDLLAALIQEPREKRRIAQALGVDALLLQSWTTHKAHPQPRHLHSLLQAVPQHQMLLRALIAEEFDDIDEVSTTSPAVNLSVAFSAHILAMHANTPEEARCWSICTAVLAEALKQSSPQQSGISLRVVQCIASAQTNRVRYLREYVGLGTSPWTAQVEFRTGFLGAESLAGETITTGLPHIIGDIRQEQRPTSSLPEHAVSAAAFPIMHTGHIAGCLLAASTQPDYFLSATRCDLLQKYTALLMLAFAPEDFYRREHIALQPMPPLQVQQPYLSTCQQRILATLKTAFSGNHTLSYPEAQQFVWGQIAEELLQLA